MSANPFARLRKLLAGPPVQVGTVVSLNGTLANVQLPGGDVVQTRGDATVGQVVFFQDGVIQGVAPSLSIVEIAKELERLGGAAKAGKVQKEDLGGTSFTISSLGKLGGLLAPPIINYPEVGIMGVHAMKRKPVVKGDQIVIGDVMNLSFSFDHRIIDGDVGAGFAQEVIGYLEQPDRLLVEMS